MGTRQTASLTERIIDAIADHEDVDPLDITPPLYEVIDLDAAETLHTHPPTESTREGVRLTFQYNEYEITVDGEDIRVKDQ